jgi:hypothetical protein
LASAAGAASTTKLMAPPSLREDDEDEDEDVLPPPIRIRLGSRTESAEPRSAGAMAGEGIVLRA